jgi:hypothetical protein
MITYSRNPLSSNYLLSVPHTGNDTALRNSASLLRIRMIASGPLSSEAMMNIKSELMIFRLLVHSLPPHSKPKKFDSKPLQVRV